MRKTKIIATLGPSTDAPGMLEGILEAGANVLRFNMSHGDHEQHAARMKKVREVCDRLGKPTATLLDTKGPEIRTGEFEKPVELQDGQKYTLTTRAVKGDKDICPINCEELPRDVKPGQRILIDDGLVEMRVESIDDTEIFCTVLNGGTVTTKKGVNCPEAKLSMPYLSERDKADLAFGKTQNFDYIAASFVRRAEDVRMMRNELIRIGWSGVRIIAKIENAEGIANIDEILEAADGIMVARGDMGVEIALEEIPSVQKTLIKKALSNGKQVVTATQMLESMISHPRPTRAEVTDVANAIYDGTAAIMLSGETAAGKYPIEAVKTMARIAERTEKDINYEERFRNLPHEICGNITTAISHSTVMTAYDLDAAAIVTVTESGWTARMVSRYRPQCPVIAGTPNPRVWRQMNMFFGVVPMLIEEKTDSDDLFRTVIDLAKNSGIVKNGEKVVFTAGLPLGKTGNTNILRVEELRID